MTSGTEPDDDVVVVVVATSFPALDVAEIKVIVLIVVVVVGTHQIITWVFLKTVDPTKEQNVTDLHRLF